MPRISHLDLERFARDLLVAPGATHHDAGIVAEALVWADLRGRHPQGVQRLPNFVARLERGLICSPAAMEWERLAPACDRLDAADGFGHVAGVLAMDRAVELARGQGVGLVSVKRSHLFGAAGYFCARAADQGCLALAFTNAVPKVAAFGGTRPVLGTNPLAFGCPTQSGTPIVVDLATSALAGSDARQRAEHGASLPHGVALDAGGKPTTDPAAAAGGCLLPAAGAKGFGLGLMVEILSGLVSGAGIGNEVGSMYGTWDRAVNIGHMFVAIDIARFQPVNSFMARLDILLDWVATSNAEPGGAGVRYPGEIRAEYAEAHRRDGIPLPDETMNALEQLAVRLRLDIPWASGASFHSDRQPAEYPVYEPAVHDVRDETAIRPTQQRTSHDFHS